MTSGMKKPRVSIIHDDVNREHTSESEATQDRDRASLLVPRPSILQKTATGGSFRLTTLSNLIHNYSILENERQSSVLNQSPDYDEIAKVQNMLRYNRPHSSTVSIPSNWEVYTQPRKTLFMAQESATNVEVSRKAWRKSEMHRIYNYISEMALIKLKADTMKKLQIVYNVHSSMVTEMPDRETAFSPFGWTLEDFITRRNENGTVWVESLLSMEEKDLDMLKFKYDMEELFKILDLLFNATIESLDGDGSDAEFKFVDDIYDFLRFPLILKLEAKRNMEKLHDQVNTYLDMLNFKRGAEEQAYKQSLEERLMDISVLGPIELRYEVNWMETKVAQAVMRISNEIKEVEDQIFDCNKEQSKEMYCSRCALDMYYYDIESFKRRIAELSHRFEQEFEQIENEISYKQISLDKLHEQRKFLEEQVKLFDEEVAQLIQKEIDDRLAEEARKREEEERALELANQKAKKKGKDKNKKKK